MCIRDRYVIVLTLLIVLPLGVGAAVYLTEYASNRRLIEVIEFTNETLAGIPSVVFGLLGMQVLVPAVAKTFGKASGACLLSAIVVLSIMILPSIVSVSVTALNAVPPEYEQGSLALGATDTDVYKRQMWGMPRTSTMPMIPATRTITRTALAQTSAVMTRFRCV